MLSCYSRSLYKFMLNVQGNLPLKSEFLPVGLRDVKCGIER